MKTTLKPLTNFQKIVYIVIFFTNYVQAQNEKTTYFVTGQLFNMEKVFVTADEDMFEDTLFTLNWKEIRNLAKYVLKCEENKEVLAEKDSLLKEYENKIQELQNKISIKQDEINQCNHFRKSNIDMLIDSEKKYSNLNDRLIKVNNKLRIYKGITITLSAVIVSAVGLYYLSAQ